MSVFDSAFDFMKEGGIKEDPIVPTPPQSNEMKRKKSFGKDREQDQPPSQPKKAKISDIVKETVKEAAAQKKTEKEEKLNQKVFGGGSSSGGSKKEPEIDLKQVIESSKAVRHEVSVPKDYPFIPLEQVLGFFSHISSINFFFKKLIFFFVSPYEACASRDASSHVQVHPGSFSEAFCGLH